MKKIGIFAVVFFVLLIGIALILPSLIPSSVYKEKIETQLTKELGREVAVMGDVKLSIFPTIKAKAGRVEIKNPEGYTDAYFATMDGLNAGVKLFPLFAKRVEITSFSLKNPEINLEKNARGEMNWMFGETEPDVKPKTLEDSGPFKRDGRFKEVETNIGRFILENGKITYADRVENIAHSLSSVDIDFKLPSLSKPLKLEGDLNYNDVDLEITLALDSIRGFLEGQKSPMSIDLDTEFASVSAKGAFLESQDLDFVFDANGSLSDLARILALMPQDVPNADLLSSLIASGDFDGTYRFESGIFSAKNAKVNVSGEGLKLVFNGNASLEEKPVLDGNILFETSQVARLAKTFAPDVKGAGLAENVRIKADFNATDTGFSGNNIEAKITGPDMNVDFAGSGEFGDTLSTQGRLSTRAGNVANIVQTLGLDIPQAAAIGAVDLTTNVSVKDKFVSLDAMVLKMTDGVLNADFTGSVSLAESPQYKGQFNGSLTSLADFAKVTSTEVPYADAIGQVVISGVVDGSGDVISVNDLSAKLSDGQLNGSYTGKVDVNMGATNIGADLMGVLDVAIPSLRKLASTAGTELPPSSDAGPIYEAFAIKGTVKGTPERIQFEGAELMIDAIRGTGDFNVDMTGAKPYATGELDLAGLDLRPYMRAYSAQKPEGGIQPWSEAPLNLEPLKTVDADLKFETPNIILERLSIGPSSASVKLKNGVLKADAPNISLYGGNGYANTVLDGSGATPSVSFDAGLNAMNSNKFLQAVAGFTNASGVGKSLVKVSATGGSQAAIMRSLSGNGDFSIKDGQISGVDLTQLLSGLDQALSSRALPGGVGSQFSTQFKDLGGAFSVQNGVVTIGDFALEGAGVAALGGGTVDLGNQKIDFNLRPRLTGKSSGALGGYGIPINVSGGFGNVKVGLDTDFLSQIVADRAKAEARTLIENQVGGQAGNILGSILGGQSSAGGANGNAQTQPQSTEQAIGGLLGRVIKPNDNANTNTAPNTTSEDIQQKDEPKVEEQIFDLFKKRKKKD